MDALITILILIGAFAASSSKKKKQRAQQAARKAKTFRTAMENMETGKKAPVPEPKPVPSPKAAPAVPKAAKEAAPAAEKKAYKPVSRPTPVLYLENDEPEGTISTQGIHSTQGESAAEHAAHREKILAEEIAMQEAHASLQELRRMNLQKLRSAVVMSEVLGKPVSLRPRGYR